MINSKQNCKYDLGASIGQSQCRLSMAGVLLFPA